MILTLEEMAQRTEELRAIADFLGRRFPGSSVVVAVASDGPEDGLYLSQCIQAADYDRARELVALIAEEVDANPPAPAALRRAEVPS